MAGDVPVESSPGVGLPGQTVELQPSPDLTPPPEPGNEEFPVAFRHYAASLRGTDDEVWTRYLQVMHGHRNMTMTEWRQTHHSVRHENAHWHKG